VAEVFAGEVFVLANSFRLFRFGEDFGLFTQKFRGAMFGLGAGLDQPALHHADYDFPDELITPAIAIYETILRQYLG